MSRRTVNWIIAACAAMCVLCFAVSGFFDAKINSAFDNAGAVFGFAGFMTWLYVTCVDD